MSDETLAKVHTEAAPLITKDHLEIEVVEPSMDKHVKMLVDSDDESETLPLINAKREKKNWWQRPNKYFASISNKTCVRRSFCISCVIGTPIMLVLVIFVIIPFAIRQSMESAPPAYVNIIDIQKMYYHNQSAGVWFQADINMRAPPTYFEPCTFDVLLMEPHQKKNGLYVSKMDLGAFSTSLSKDVDLNFHTVSHDFDIDNIRKTFKRVAEHLTRSFTGGREFFDREDENRDDEKDGYGDEDVDNEIVGINRVRTDVWRMRMISSNVNADMFGLQLKNLHLNYDIPIQVDPKNFLANFKPAKQRCEIVTDGEREDCETALPTMLTRLSKATSLDDEDLSSIEVDISIGNPTVFGLNIGHMEVDISYIDEEGNRMEFITSTMPNFVVKQTGRRTDIRQTLGSVIKFTSGESLTALIAIQKTWSSGKNAIVEVSDIRFFGYPDDVPESGGNSSSVDVKTAGKRLHWLEDALRDFNVKVALPKLI